MDVTDRQVAVPRTICLYMIDVCRAKRRGIRATAPGQSGNDLLEYALVLRFVDVAGPLDDVAFPVVNPAHGGIDRAGQLLAADRLGKHRKGLG